MKFLCMSFKFLFLRQNKPHKDKNKNMNTADIVNKSKFPLVQKEIAQIKILYLPKSNPENPLAF